MSIHQDLENTAWVKEIFTDLLEKCTTFSYYNELTDAITATLKDDAWIKDIYKTVEKQGTDNSERVKLAAVVAQKFNDKDWAKIFWKPLNKTAGLPTTSLLSAARISGFWMIRTRPLPCLKRQRHNAPIRHPMPD